MNRRGLNFKSMTKSVVEKDSMLLLQKYRSELYLQAEKKNVMSHEVSKISHPESPMKKKVKPKNELSLFPYMVLKYKEEGAVEEEP